MIHSLKRALTNWLAEPSSRGLDLNDPALTERRKTLLKDKRFLERVYREWYQKIRESIPAGGGKALELGSGAGFLDEVYPGLIKSEVFWLAGNHLVLDGARLPFKAGSLKAIVMTDVLHHIPRPRDFFGEACRCLQPDGRIVMVEPWYTAWSGWVYRNLHHEPFAPEAADWEFPSSGPLSGANGALPWILFQRDRRLFEREFPCLTIEQVQIFMPFRYLLSGGVSMRSLAPAWSFAFWRRLENGLAPWMGRLGMFALIVLRRAPERASASFSKTEG